MLPHEELPSGKTIFRGFDASGSVTSEMHAYGMLDIAITFDFRQGKKTSETYFVKKRLVSRERYEKARVDYADMPAPDTQLEDINAQLLKAVRAEHKHQAQLTKAHVPDTAAAAQMDLFCDQMLRKGVCADAESWIVSKNHTLGEYSHVKSRNLFHKLKQLGTSRVYACDIDDSDENQNTGHLVVELPESPTERKAVMREIGRLSQQQGFQRDPDNGQRYAYIKLD